jgi:ABC-type multidrug transport system fused ATPase/permease subunit
MLRYGRPALDAFHKDLSDAQRDAAPAQPGSKKGSVIRMQDCLALHGLTYTYPGARRPALEDLNLVVPRNTTVGLVGSTGAGKTTLVDVILGLLSPQAGALMVDGKKIDADTMRPWQRSLGYVPQQIVLIDDTVAANIAFGVPNDEIDMAAVENAARIAELHTFVVEQLSDGYATSVGERGVRLSGGQRQRIGIARALYHNPDVLILDEATSALDNLTERAVMDAVHNLAHAKTVVIIAHRLSTVRACDTIFVLENGHCIAEGSYDELLQTNADFRVFAQSAA